MGLGSRPQLPVAARGALAGPAVPHRAGGPSSEISSLLGGAPSTTYRGTSSTARPTRPDRGGRVARGDQEVDLLVIDQCGEDRWQRHSDC